VVVLYREEGLFVDVLAGVDDDDDDGDLLSLMLFLDDFVV